MSDGINVPINLPTDSSAVKTAANVVKALEANLAALGPAAAAGSVSAVNSMARTGAAIAKVQAQALAANKAVANVNAKGAGVAAKRDAAIDVVNAKGSSAFQLAQQKALADFGKIRAKQEGAVEIQNARAAAKAADQARAQAHALEMARIKQRGAAEKGPGKGSAKPGGSPAGAAEDTGVSGLEALAPVLSVAVSVAAAIGAIVMKVASLTAAFYAALVSVQAFREATANAFSKLLGGAEAANAAMRSTIAMAGGIGVGVKDALGGVNALLAKGFRVQEAQDLVKAMADLKSVVPDANISNLLLAISQIKSKGVLQMEELQGQIAEAGLSVSVVLEEIGKKIGKSGAEVRKMIAAGKIGADAGVQGILAAIQKTTGKPLGKAAEDAANSLQGLLARVNDLPTALLLAADSSKGMGTVKGALQSVLAAFGPGTKSGDALAASLGKMGNALSTFLSGLTGKSGGDALTTFATGLAHMVDKLAAYTEKVGTALGPRIGKAIEMMGTAMENGTFDRVLDVVTGAIDAFLMTIEVVDRLRDAFSSAAAEVTRIGVALGLIQGTTEPIAGSMSTAGNSIGTNLVQGIIQGITGGLPGLLVAVGAMAASTTGAAKTGFNTHSPSVIWDREIGYQLPAGAARGVRRGAPLMLNAARGLASNTNATAARAIGSGGGGSRGGLSIAPGAIVIQVDGRGQDDAALADKIETRLRSLLIEFSAA